jgi:hypothetical protein
LPARNILSPDENCPNCVAATHNAISGMPR